MGSGAVRTFGIIRCRAENSEAQTSGDGAHGAPIPIMGIEGKFDGATGGYAVRSPSIDSNVVR